MQNPSAARRCPIFIAGRCERCRERILTQGRRASRYCSDACEATAQGFAAGYCRECAAPYVVAATRASVTRYCSDECRRRNRRRRDKQARSKRIRAAGPREVIDLAHVAKRDGWRCHICKRKVTRRNWSLDHLIPLSDGGPHTHANVALAHVLCNSKRGARGAAQLRLAA